MNGESEAFDDLGKQCSRLRIWEKQRSWGRKKLGVSKEEPESLKVFVHFFCYSSLLAGLPASAPSTVTKSFYFFLNLNRSCYFPDHNTIVVSPLTWKKKIQTPHVAFKGHPRSSLCFLVAYVFSLLSRKEWRQHGEIPVRSCCSQGKSWRLEW